MVRYNSEGHADWKFYQIGPNDFIYSAYNRSRTLMAAPSKLQRKIKKKRGIMAAPIARTSYNGKGNKKQGVITSYHVQATRQEIQEIADAAGKSIEIRNIFGFEEEQEIEKVQETPQINLFELPPLPPITTAPPTEEEILQAIAEAKIRAPYEGLDGKVDKAFNIVMEYVPFDFDKTRGKIDIKLSSLFGISLPWSDVLTERLQKALRHDIAQFCNYIPNLDPEIENIGPIPVETIDTTVEVIIREPKQGEMVRLGKGGYTHCYLDIGIDFSVGCIANFLPDEGMTSIDDICTYCYQKFTNAVPFIGTIFDIDEQRVIDDTKQMAVDIIINEFIAMLNNEYVPVKSGVSHLMGRDYDLPEELNPDLEKILCVVEKVNQKIEKYNEGKPKKSQKSLIHYITKSNVKKKFKKMPGDLFDTVEAYARELLEVEKIPMYIRFGQRTECFVPSDIREDYGIPNNLEIGLKAMAQLVEDGWNIAGVVPTKMPEYSDELRDLMIAANFGLMVSIGRSGLESGINKHGFGYRERCDEALKFAEQGIETTFFIATDITRPMSEMQPDAKYTLNFFEKHKAEYPNLGIQFLDMRITSREQAEHIGGADWDTLKYNSPATWLEPVEVEVEPETVWFDETLERKTELRRPNRWGLTGQSYLAPKHVHPEFLDLIATNSGGEMRMCYTHGEDNQCGGCYIDKIKIT